MTPNASGGGEAQRYFVYGVDLEPEPEDAEVGVEVVRASDYERVMRELGEARQALEHCRIALAMIAQHAENGKRMAEHLGGGKPAACSWFTDDSSGRCQGCGKWREEHER